MIKIIIKIKNNIIEIIKGTAESWKYVVCYIGVIFLFAIIYTFLPNSFYHSTVQYESSLSMDENDILNDIKKNIIKSQKDYTDEKIQVNEKVYIDGNKTSIDSLKYEEKNEVSFEVDICTNEETNDDIALGAARRKFTFSLDNKIKEFNKDSKSYIYYFILTPDVSSDNSDIFGYKDIELYKALFPAKLINGYDSPNILMTMDSESFNKINNLKNAKNGFPSGVSNNFVRVFYLSAVTITTVGYGDIVPITTLARISISVEAILGVILVGLFLNSLSLRISNEISKKEKEKDEQQKKVLEIKKLLRYDKVVQINIEEYLLYTKIITTPMEKRPGTELNKEFKFNDMCDLFKTSLLFKDNSFEPAVNKYFKYQKKLNEVIQQLVFNVELIYWTDLEILLIDILRSSDELDYSTNIMNASNVKWGDKLEKEIIEKAIREHTGKVEFKESNLIIPYIALYYQIKSYIEFIEKYNNIISDIRVTDNDLKSCN